MGVKAGDYGTGRKYSYYTKGSKGEGGEGCCLVVTVIALLIVSYLWYAFEALTAGKIETVNNSRNEIVQLEEGAYGLRDLQNSQLDAKLVALQNVGVSTVVVDTDANLEFYNVSTVSRNTEYCQWQEFRHETRTAVGIDSNNDTIYRVDVSFTYAKGWHSMRINSYLFDSPISYNNPQRDPIPSRVMDTNYGEILGMEGKRLYVNSNLLKPERTSVPFRFPRQYYIPDYLYHNGFDHTDGRYLVSKYRDNYGGMKAMAGYLIEGVIDLGGWWETCAAGDIRVSYSQDMLAPKMSMIAEFNHPERLKEFRRGAESADVFMSQPGSYGADALVSMYIEELLWQLKKWRVIYGLLLVVISGVGYVAYDSMSKKKKTKSC